MKLTRTLLLSTGMLLLTVFGPVLMAESGKKLPGSKTGNIKVDNALSGGNSGDSSSVKTGETKYNFSSAKSRILAVGLGINGSSAPGWSPDSSLLVVPFANADDRGLMVFDLRNNKTWASITEEPTFKNTSTKLAHSPVIFGDTVFYQMGVSHYRRDKRNTYYPWMSVPVKGGKPVLVFELIQGELLLSARKKNDKSEFLLLQKKDDKFGLFTMTEDNSDPEKSEPFLAAKENLKPRVSVSANWSQWATADHWKPWTVYSVSGAQLAILPQGFGDKGMMFSPDGAYAAGPTTDSRTYQSQMAVAPINNSGETHVLDKGAIRYGVPAWSPNGRYLAFPIFGGSGDKLVIVDLTGGKNSFAEGDTLLTRE